MTYPANIVTRIPTKLITDTRGDVFSTIDRVTSDEKYIEDDGVVDSKASDQNTDFLNRILPRDDMDNHVDPWKGPGEDMDTQQSIWEGETEEESFWDDPSTGQTIDVSLETSQEGGFASPAAGAGASHSGSYETEEVIKGGSDAILMGAMLLGVAFALYSTMK